jgi:hypothetical protein
MSAWCQCVASRGAVAADLETRPTSRKPLSALGYLRLASSRRLGCAPSALVGSTAFLWGLVRKLWLNRWSAYQTAPSNLPTA